MAVNVKVKEKVASASPVVTRVARDKKFQQHVRSAVASARTIYDELFGGGPVTEAGARKLVARLAQDPDLQNELRRVVAELRAAGKRAKEASKPSHTGRNALLLAGIVIGILYNPKTGPETRKWLKERLLGGEDTFEFETES